MKSFDSHLLFIALSLSEEPNFGKTKTYHEFLVNQTAHVPCVVTGKPDVEINWYRDGHLVSNDGRTLATGYPCGTGVSSPSSFSVMPAAGRAEGWRYLHSQPVPNRERVAHFKTCDDKDPVFAHLKNLFAGRMGQNYT